MATPQRESMRNADKMWLDRDLPTNLMIINSVMLFDEVIDFERVVQILEERLVARYKRFRQRVVDTAGPGVQWEEDPFFDIRCHLRHIALPAPGTVETLQNLVSDLSSEALEPLRPLWRFWVIENVEGGSAVFGRLHHAMADGVALVQVLLSLTDPSPEEQIAAVAEAEPPRGGRGLLAQVRSAARRGAGLALRGTRMAIREGVATLEDPSRIVENAKHVGMASLTGAAIVSKLVLIPPDTDSAFKGELGSHKRVVWSEPLPLDEVKAIGRMAGATINDLLVTAVAGALRHYMLEHGRPADIRAMIPVNLRDLNKPITELGNQFSLVYLRLPLETAGALERLSIVKQQMDVLKQSPEPLIVYGILSILGMAPGPVSNAAADWFSNKASAVLTNVPGPREPIFFAGLPLKRILFWVPSTGRIGLGISIISYNGEVTLGISVDEGLIAEPAQITARFREEIELLRDAIEAAGPRAARNGAAPLAGTPAATPVATAKDPVVEMAEEWPHGANPPHPLHGGLSVEEAPVEEPEEGRSARPASD